MNNDPLKTNVINSIFSELHGRFGNAFFDKWRSGDIKNGLDSGIQNAKQVWARRLSGFIPKEIKRGIDADYVFLPSCDDFRNKCRPTLNHQRAYIEACKQMNARQYGNDVWEDKSIFFAARKLGSDLRNNSYADIKIRWSAALEDARESERLGELPSKVPAPRLQNQSALSRL